MNASRLGTYAAVRAGIASYITSDSGFQSGSPATSQARDRWTWTCSIRERARAKERARASVKA
eukprot:3221992-Heterocapsa_arctica.AAC.1